MDAIQLCLRAISSPGEVIITESPTFTCYLQFIEDMGLLALELPILEILTRRKVPVIEDDIYGDFYLPGP
ncbi:MAG: hypothetical protein KQH63_09690 [Desulfobulbaceae bacterium]|nr:hypothetical protein [Desulfobulbaceae bacterium]